MISLSLSHWPQIGAAPRRCGVSARRTARACSQFKNDPAGASDLDALITVMLGDLDAAAMSDFYGRLTTVYNLGIGTLANGSAVRNEFALADPSNRIYSVWKDLLDNGCVSSSSGGQLCSTLQQLWYPDYPAVLP